MTVTTDTTPATPGLQHLTDDELAALYRGDDPAAAAAAIREAARQDREKRLAATRAKLAAIHAEGERQAYAQYRDADRACCGVLLSRAGKAAHARGEFADETALWRMPGDKARAYCSEELGLYWLHVAPRVTAREYVRQQAAEKRGEYARARDNRDMEARNEHDDGTGLAGPAAGALRRETPAPQAPERAGGPVQRGRRDRAEDGARSGTGAADGRPVRPVQRDGVAGVGIIGAAIAADRALKARQDARQEQAVAVPSGVPAAYRPTGAAAANEPRIPGDQLLDLLESGWFSFYARMPSKAAADLVTLWAAHCWMRDENGVLVTRATPRLYLLSSEPGSGKSQVLELLSMVVPNCHGLDLEPTAPGLAYTLSSEHATVLIDESDVLFGQGMRRQAVRAIINGGYTRRGTYLSGKGGKATRLPIFGPVAMAGLDTMETGTGESLKALLSRGIKVRMEKAPADNQPAELTAASEDAAGKVQYWLERWAGQVRDEVAQAMPEVPEGLDGRAKQIWIPLLNVADAAGGTWPDRARAACRELTLAEPQDDDMEAQFAEFASEFAAT